MYCVSADWVALPRICFVYLESSDGVGLVVAHVGRVTLATVLKKDFIILLNKHTFFLLKFIKLILLMINPYKN